jgi:hypothetical protein
MIARLRRHRRARAFVSIGQSLRKRSASESEQYAVFGQDPMHLAMMALKDIERSSGCGVPCTSNEMWLCRGEACEIIEDFNGAEQAYYDGLSEFPTDETLRESLERLRREQDDSPVTSGVSQQPKITPRKLRLSSCELDLDCTICFKLLYEPTTLPCGHTFCRRCMVQALDHKQCCPLCRTIVFLSSSASSLPITVSLQRVIERSFPEEYAARREERRSESWRYESILPLFVMTTMLPGKTASLNIFEPRYRLLVRRCMEGNRLLGIIGINRQVHLIFS